MLKNIGYEGLFQRYDNIIRLIKTRFVDYDVKHSELPSIIDFNKQIEPVDLNINIIGPKKK